MNKTSTVNPVFDWLAIDSFGSNMSDGAATHGEFGFYEVLQEIGNGSFSQVYEARDARDGRHVALKVFHNNNFGGENFVREVGVGMTLKHPNLINALDLGYAAKNRRYVAYELARGGSLRNPMTEKIVTPNFVRHAVIEIARGLTALHGQNLVHRDIKPENILLAETGDFPRLRLTDWGTAERVKRDELAKGESGSPAYMSPEQINGLCDTRADVYSLGVIAYEMLNGKRPFLGSPVEVLRGHLRREPDWQNFAPAVAVVLARALEKKPEARYQTAYHFARDLDLALTTENNKNAIFPFNTDDSADGVIANDGISGWQIRRDGALLELQTNADGDEDCSTPIFEILTEPNSRAAVCASSLVQIGVRDANRLVISSGGDERRVENRIYGLPPLVALRKFAGEVVTVENVVNPAIVVRRWDGAEAKRSPLETPLSALLVVAGASGEHILGVDINRRTLIFLAADHFGARPALFQLDEDIASLNAQAGKAWLETVSGKKHDIEIN